MQNTLARLWPLAIMMFSGVEALAIARVMCGAIGFSTRNKREQPRVSLSVFLLL